MNIKIDTVRVGVRARKTLPNIKSLADSITALGLLHPIVVTPDRELIAGQRRLEACRILGWKEIPANEVSTLNDAVSQLRAERDENSEREPLTPEEAVELGRRLEALERPKARARQATNPASANLAEAETPGETRKKVADALGMGHTTYEKAKRVVEAAEDKPELRPVVDEMNRTGKVDPAYKQVVAASKPASDDDEVLDGLKNPVTRPDHRIVFRALPEFTAIRRDIMALFKRIEALAVTPAGRLVKLPEVTCDTRNLKEAIKFAMPYTTCAYCAGKSKTCKACQGTGWMTKLQYDNAPSELKS